MFAKIVEIKLQRWFAPLLLVWLLAGAQTGFAAPWDIDMFRQPSLKPNEIVRNPVKGTVPMGFKPFTMTREEAGEKLRNPVQSDENSLWRGGRLWSVNCTPCHGVTGRGDGSIGELMNAPSLLEDLYKNRTDGHIYGTIQLGGANMPRYGYKFSDREKWDVINYLRYLQGTRAQVQSSAR